MTKITAAMVSELRQKTGVGILDCKKALTECDGNIEASVELLRKKGLAAAGKKAGRSAADGLVSAKVSADGKMGVVVEVNSETDFVARNEQFQELINNIANSAIAFNGDLETFKSSSYNNSNETVEAAVQNAIAVIGENIVLRRFAKLAAPAQGAVVNYVHNAVAQGLGKIAVLVALESTAPQEKLAEIGKFLAMHIAAFAPEALTSAELSSEKVETEKRVFKEQALAAGKPEAVVDKMVEGRVRKYYQEVVLLEQAFLTDNKKSVAEWLQEASKECGAEVKIVSYIRYALGEGIEKQESDFAAEVAAMAS
jgi:elongation factor Ts